MSRIAKKPIELPAAVTLTLENGNISVKGPKGTLQDLLPPLVDLKKEDDKVIIFNL
jgi:large subunit ribosomal protein L6